MEIQDYNVNIYFIPLFNDLSYSTSFVINNTQCTLNFGYNSRLNQRFFNVTTSSGIVLLQNTFIQLKNNIKLNVNFDFLGNGTTDIYFKKIDETLPLDISSWASNVEMYIRTVPPESKSQENYNNIAVWVTDTETTTNSIDEFYDKTDNEVGGSIIVPPKGGISNNLATDSYNWSTMTFDEYPIGAINPNITKQIETIGEVTSSFFASFVGQTVVPLNSSYTISGKPTTGVKLSPDTNSGYSTQIASDSSNPMSPVMSGSVMFNSPISVLFSTPVHAIMLDGGVFDSAKSTYIEVYDLYGNVIGSNINSKIGIESFGFSSGKEANISGFSFYINGNEPAGFGIDNLRII